jgi:hypothetical protein
MNFQTAYSSLAQFSVFKAQDGDLYIWGHQRKGSLGLGDVKQETMHSPRKLLFGDVDKEPGTIC